MRRIVTMRIRRDTINGMALPAALFFSLTITSLAAIFAQLAMKNMEIVQQQEATTDTFEIAEGVVHDLLRQIVINPHLWRQRVPLPDEPDGYAEFSPADFTSRNGIPNCTGIACERNMFPTGGGFIKNFGPIGSAGDSVDTDFPASEQLDPENLPDPDIELNSRPGWVQVERLDESFPSSNTIGADISNNPQAGGNANVIRFRVTGTALRAVKGANGGSTVVVIVEVPNA